MREKDPFFGLKPSKGNWRFEAVSSLAVAVQEKKKRKKKKRRKKSIKKFRTCLVHKLKAKFR